MNKKSYNRYNNPNYVEKLKRLYQWAKGGKAPSFKLSIIPTNRCNLNCFFCPNSVARDKGRFKVEDELEKERWSEIIQEAIDLGVKEWRILGGGEPLVKYEITTNILKKVKNHNNMNCEIITNGTLFKSEDIKTLVKQKLDRITFSIHGPNAETHDNITGVSGAFKLVNKNITKFKKIKEKLGLDKPIIQINTVLNKHNFNKVIEMLKYSKKVGGTELVLHPMRAYEEIKNQVEELKLTAKEKSHMIKEIKKAKKLSKGSKLILDLQMMEESGIKLSDGGGRKNKFLNARCFEPFYGLLVCPESKATHCVPHGMGRNELNLKEKSLKEIWYGEYFEEIREKILNDVMMKCCENCGLLDMSKRLRKDLRLYINSEGN